MQQGRAISLFLFLLVSVMSLVISVMSLVLSWNSSTERSEGEVFHGFYVLIWKGVRIWKQARILKGVRSCHEIAWLSAAAGESNVMVSISFCLCPVRIWAGVRSSHEIAWLNTAMESYFIVFFFLSLSLVILSIGHVRTRVFKLWSLHLMWLVLNR